MSKAAPGNTVKVHYTGRLKDGTVFDSTVGRDPVVFTIGKGEILPGFEREVIGMTEGETKTAEIDAEDAFGPRREDQVIAIDRSRIPDTIEPEVGGHLQMVKENGETIAITVKEVTDERVVVDANHPLAGQDLTFNIELVEVA